MKAHNGGAVSLYCHYIDYIYHQDIQATSNYSTKLAQTTFQLPPNKQMIYISEITTGEIFAIYKSRANLEENIFKENFSGGKGSAVYIRQMSDVRIQSNVF